jgi:hypothetical protein
MMADPWNPLRIGAGAAAIAAATAIAAILPDVDDPLRPVLVAVALGWCAYRMTYVWESLALAALALLMINGFLTGRYGRPPWDSADGIAYLPLLVLAILLGVGQRWIRAGQADAAFDVAVRELMSDAGADDADGNESGR